jgi:predicted adenylyl cyclase CyaB
MPRNIEIKARIDSVDALIPLAAALADHGPIEIPQDDTFFRCAAGRLKLRCSADGSGELIFYSRANQPGPKQSTYSISKVSSPDSLRQLLSQAYGEVGRVIKHRTLYLIGRTRVHLDKVERLGHFLELEAVLGVDEPPAGGVRELNDLMQKLNVHPAQLIDGAYIDMLYTIHCNGG